jgi:hypothetical protein
MESITKDQLQELASVSGINCVSIYLPTHRRGKEVNEGKDAIVLKNHYQKIRAEMQEKGFSDQEANTYLQPIRALIDDASFWRYQQQGLAVFLADDFFKTIKLSYTAHEFSWLSTSFDLGQLVPLTAKNRAFYILGISLNKVRLLEADEHNAEEIDLSSQLPEGMEDALSYYDFEKNLQYHSGGSQTGTGGTIFHGQGGDGDKEDVYIAEYFRRVDEALEQLIAHRDRPVVLAAVEAWHPVFRKANTNIAVHPTGITGNPDNLSPQELHQQAIEVLQDYFYQDQKKDHARYTSLMGSNQTSYEIEEIAPAALDGRIDALFVARGAHRWGVIDRSNNEVELTDEPGPNAHDLISKAAVETVLHGGRAYLVDAEYLPETVDGALLAAVFRY